MVTKELTTKEWLTKLADTDTSQDRDSRMMERLLHMIGFPLAKVVLGIVYLDGQGTMEAPPNQYT